MTDTPSAVANNRCPRPSCGGELTHLTRTLTHHWYQCESCGHGIMISLAPEITPTKAPPLRAK